MSENCKPVTFLSALAATSKRQIQEYIITSRWSHLHIQIFIDPYQRCVISFSKSASPNDYCSYKHCSVKEIKNTNFDREPDPNISKYASTPAILFTPLLSTSGGTSNQQSANRISFLYSPATMSKKTVTDFEGGVGYIGIYPRYPNSYTVIRVSVTQVCSHPMIFTFHIILVILY